MNHSLTMVQKVNPVLRVNNGTRDQPRSIINLSHEVIEIPDPNNLSPSNQSKKENHRLSNTTTQTIPFRMCHTQSTLPLQHGEPLLMFSLAPISDDDDDDYIRCCDFPGDMGFDRPETEIDKEAIQSIQVLPFQSIQSPLQKRKRKNRKDRFNTPINPDQKSYRVTFRDQVTQQRIKDIHIVQNWKYIYKKVEDDDNCCCLIF